MPETDGLSDYWLDIDPERMERYETMYQWNPASEPFYTAAQIGEGHVVGDFGCGPGHAAIEFAKRVGPTGHVHAFDINSEFVRRARDRAEANDLGERITVHLLEDHRLPVPDAEVDRMIARNTIIYVARPKDTFSEFRRVVKPGGIAHCIEGDWRLTLVEPVPTEEWSALIEAASWAWPRPEMGRGLYGFLRRAGFGDVSVQVITRPDTEGRLTAMNQTVAANARKSGKLETRRIDAILQTVERAKAEGDYLAISPQFVVTATA